MDDDIRKLEQQREALITGNGEFVDDDKVDCSLNFSSFLRPQNMCAPMLHALVKFHIAKMPLPAAVLFVVSSCCDSCHKDCRSVVIVLQPVAVVPFVNNLGTHRCRCTSMFFSAQLRLGTPVMNDFSSISLLLDLHHLEDTLP